MSEEYLTDLSRSISQLGREHSTASLELDQLDPDPIEQFGRWMQEALDAGIMLPNTMTLATASADGAPSARMVLLKGVDSEGFSFFTNFESRKGRELAANPRAALVFHWPDLARQVRVAGSVTRLGEPESDDYFSTRPPGSKFGAWASPQSETLGGRRELEQRVDELATQYPDGDMPRPSHWGGYRVGPIEIEFWQGRSNRLHDRFLYERSGDHWSIRRLAP